MTLNSLPWSAIDPPAALRLHTIRADEKHALDFRWAKNADAQYLLLLYLQPGHTGSLLRELPILNGISTDVREDTDINKHMLVLALQDRNQADIFWRLCLDLIESTRAVSDEITAASLIIIRLKRWQAFLSRKNRNILAPHEVKGLFAEIHFIEELLLRSSYSADVIVEAWRGPLGAPQDFQLPGAAVEIKSISETAQHTVRVSSREQLYVTTGLLYLRVYTLSESDNTTAVSLNTKAAAVKELIERSDGTAALLFEDRLTDAGYLPDLADYDAPAFRVSTQSTYKVDGEFPCLTPANLPLGVVRTIYDVDLSLIESFRNSMPFME
jgi:hypothetical protein